jgi:hypothetical protein
MPTGTKKEKTVLIERVENGWIVRPFSPCDYSNGCAASGRVWVFNSMVALVSALPDIVQGPTLAPDNKIPNEPL